MSVFSERPGLGRPSRMAAVAIVSAVALCLAVAGCSASSVLGASSSTAIASPNPAGPPPDPFSGTPADHWADGTAGIAVPAAKAVGSFSRAQVESAYQTTRRMLIAADLDPTILHGGAPTAFADLLTPQDRTWFLDGLNKSGADKTGAALSTRTVVVSFAPGTTKLIGSVIKVHGSMSARAATDSGSAVLDIDVDYIFVYPVEPPGQPQNWTRVISEAAWVISFGNWQGTTSTFTPSYTNTAADGVAGASCQTKDGYVHPAYPNNATSGPTPSGKPIDPYTPGQSINAACGAATGT